ncbi:MAG: 30S ribosomal protein S8 [Fibrobacterota bacterium]
MSVTDPIADMLTRIRNALQANKKTVDVPASGLKIEIAKILTSNDFIEKFVVVDDGKQGILKILLKYDDDGRSVIQKMKRLSKPSLRRYAKASNLPRSLGGLGTVIMSTPEGIMTGRDARNKNVGGEILCEVW